jgi:Kef-type K+ transport system membrane component KefB
VRPAEGSRAPRALLAWEGLPGPAQAALAFPPLLGLFFLFHWALLGLSPTRSLFYGVFWGLTATGAVVIATRTEATKRRHGDPHERD